MRLFPGNPISFYSWSHCRPSEEDICTVSIKSNQVWGTRYLLWLPVFKNGRNVAVGAVCVSVLRLLMYVMCRVALLVTYCPCAFSHCARRISLEQITPPPPLLPLTRFSHDDADLSHIIRRRYGRLLHSLRILEQHVIIDGFTSRVHSCLSAYLSSSLSPSLSFTK